MSEVPFVLLPYQQRWMADKSSVKVCEKSRRIGLSWTEAADSALEAAAIDGMDTWYIGYNQDMAQEFINDTAFWAKNYNLVADAMEEVVLVDEDKDILAYRIRFASGHRVTALSSRPSNLRGKQGKVVIDEAAFHDALDELLKAAIALLMWGGRVVVISTHDGDENPFNELINEIRAGKKSYTLHRITIDDALNEGLYQRICLKLGRNWTATAEAEWRQELIDFYGDDADEELLCIPAQGGGTYLSAALIKACMSDAIPVLQWACKDEFVDLPEEYREAEARDWCVEHLAPLLAKLDPNSPSYFGEDFARTGDLTVITPLQEDRKLNLRAPFVLELRNVPFEQQKQVLFYIADRLPRFLGGALDSRGNGQYLGEVARQKYGPERIAQVMLSESWYRENMPKYKSRFEDRSILLPQSGDVLDDHRALKMTKGVARLPETGKQKGRDGKQRHGDSAIAGALAVFAAATIDSGPVEYKTVSRGRFSGRRRGLI